MELVQTTKGFVSESPKAATVTTVACAVAITAVALLIAGVRTGGTTATLTSGAPTRASVLAGLSPQSRRQVEAIESMTPAQRVAAFGTPSAQDLRSAAYVAGIESMTPVQRIEAFGTEAKAASALASLTPKERVYVESIMAMTPAELRATFGTEGAGR